MSRREKTGFKEPSAPPLQRNDACQEFGTDGGEGGPVLHYIKLALKALVLVPGGDGACTAGYAD